MTDTLPAYNMDKPNVDLSFLNDKERAVILKVIKADLELKKTTLGSVMHNTLRIHTYMHIIQILNFNFDDHSD